MINQLTANFHRISKPSELSGQQNVQPERLEKLCRERSGLQKDCVYLTRPRGIRIVFLSDFVPANRLACVQVGQCIYTMLFYISCATKSFIFLIPENGRTSDNRFETICSNSD